MSKILIEIQKLTVGYESQTILKDIDFCIKSDDFIGIIGPNGGGKTTLIKSILGLIPAWNGTIQMNIPRTKIGYLPQFNAFDKAFPISVKEVILSGLSGKKGLFNKYTSIDFQRADELMDQAAIKHLKNKAIGKLSGGQAQRALLCRALMNDPELLILDEPSTFVDHQFESELFEWLKKLNDNMAILMVSHDVGTLSGNIKTIACVNRDLHHHQSSKITTQQLHSYNCPMQLITHGEVPHQVLSNH